MECKYFILMYPSFINDEMDELMQLLKIKKIPDKNINSHSEPAHWSEFSGYNTTTG